MKVGLSIGKTYIKLIYSIRKTMKKVMMALLGLMTMTIMSCGDDSGAPKMSNYWTLSKENKTLYDDDTEGVKVTVTLALTPNNDVTLVPELTGDADLLSAFELSTSAVQIAKGSKTAEFYVRAKSNQLIAKAGTLKIGFQENSDMKTGELLDIAVAPKISVELTEEQLALVKAWQSNYGIDVRQFVGTLGVKTTITFGDDDKEQFNHGENTIVFDKDVAAVTISESAKEDKIVLKMSANPMGMQEFIRNMYAAVTINDKEYWQTYPVAKALLTLVEGQTDMSKFMVTLDNIVIDPVKKTIEFIRPNGDGKNIVPFNYDYPAWTTLQQAAKEGKEVAVNEGDTDVMYPVSELITQSGTLNPDFYLGNSDVTVDEYYGNNFVNPIGTFDSENSTMTFKFSWDFGAGSWLYDYVKVNVVYTLNK